MTSVPWSHISSADIFVLLEHVNSTTDPNLQLRVVEGTNNLENIPLTRLVAAASRIKQAHEETSGTFAKVEHLPIFAMTKVNAIAIRYNTPHAESRRTQLNFNNDQNRRELLRMLQDMGMVVQFPEPKQRMGAPSAASSSPSPVPSSLHDPSQDARAPVHPSLNDHPFSTSIPQRSHDISSRPDPPVYDLQDLLPPRRTLPFGKTNSPKSSIYSDELEPLPKPNFVGEPKLGRSSSAHTDRKQQVPKGESITEWQKRIVNQHVERLPRGMPPPPEVFILPNGATKNGPHGGSPDISIYEDESDRQISDHRSSIPTVPSSSTMHPTSPYLSTMGSPPRPSTVKSSDHVAPSSVTFERPSSPIALIAQSPNREVQGTSVLGPSHDVILDEFERIMTNPRFEPADGSDGQELAAYAQQSRTQRMDVLNSMICDYLQDENFRTLCVDVENAWRLRIVNEQAGSRQ